MLLIYGLAYRKTAYNLYSVITKYIYSVLNTYNSINHRTHIQSDIL